MGNLERLRFGKTSAFQIAGETMIESHGSLCRQSSRIGRDLVAMMPEILAKAEGMYGNFPGSSPH